MFRCVCFCAAPVCFHTSDHTFIHLSIWDYTKCLTSWGEFMVILMRADRNFWWGAHSWLLCWIMLPTQIPKGLAESQQSLCTEACLTSEGRAPLSTLSQPEVVKLPFTLSWFNIINGGGYFCKKTCGAFFRPFKYLLFEEKKKDVKNLID